MALDSYETRIELNKLYTARKKASGSERINPAIFIKTGKVNIYGSQSETQPTSLSDMVLPDENKDVSGFANFSQNSFVPRYIALQESEATVSELIAVGLDIIEIGAIS